MDHEDRIETLEIVKPVVSVVETTETTTSTSYTALTSPDTVTVNVPASGKIRVEISLHVANSVAGNSSRISAQFSGANTLAANNSNNGTIWFIADSNAFQTYTSIAIFEGLNPGITTVSLQYVVSSGTGTFRSRNLIVTPLP